MALFNVKKKELEGPINYTSTVGAKIQQRRLQILVHSFLYYQLDRPLVSDDKWQQWAEELVALQNKHPDIAKQVVYHHCFSDFDGSTGFDLPFNEPLIVEKGMRLLRREIT